MYIFDKCIPCNITYIQYCTIIQNSFKGFPGGSVVKNLPDNAGHVGLIPGSGRSPGERNGNLLQYSYLGNPMDRGGRQAIVHWIMKELDTT